MPIFPVLLAATMNQGLLKPPAQDVQKIVESRLPSLGHRNWIVVADSAYPLQTAPGIETVTVNVTQEAAVKGVLAALGKAKHVRPNIYIDKELDFVSEKFAPGIEKYRTDLGTILKGKTAKKEMHESIIGMLDEAGKTFKILLIKTPHIQPYTSVFFQLECGYWSDEAEKDLRDRMKGGG